MLKWGNTVIDLLKFFPSPLTDHMFFFGDGGLLKEGFKSPKAPEDSLIHDSEKKWFLRKLVCSWVLFLKLLKKFQVPKQYMNFSIKKYKQSKYSFYNLVLSIFKDKIIFLCVPFKFIPFNIFPLYK